MDERSKKAIRPVKRNDEWYAVEVHGGNENGNAAYAAEMDDGHENGNAVAGPFDSERDAWDWVQLNTG